MNSLKVKRGDQVVVIASADKGKKGKVITTDAENNKVLVEGVNLQKHHKKPRSAKETGGIVSKEGFIDVSNVMVVCPACNKAVRVSYQIEGDKKIRVCKKCGKPLDATKEAKEVKKAAAKKKTKKAADAE